MKDETHSNNVTKANPLSLLAYIMMATSISYVIIQMPGLIFFNSSPEIQARRESGFALVTLLLCVSSFIAYLVYQRMIPGI